MSPYLRTIALLSVGLLAVFGWHFATVLGFFGNAPETRFDFFIRLGVIMIGFLVVSAIAAAVTARHKENAIMPDEREAIIVLKVERLGGLALYAGLLIVLWFAFSPMTPMQIANAILAVVCASEFIKLLYGMAIMNRPL